MKVIWDLVWWSSGRGRTPIQENKRLELKGVKAEAKTKAKKKSREQIERREDPVITTPNALPYFDQLAHNLLLWFD